MVVVDTTSINTIIPDHMVVVDSTSINTIIPDHMVVIIMDT